MHKLCNGCAIIQYTSLLLYTIPSQLRDQSQPHKPISKSKSDSARAIISFERDNCLGNNLHADTNNCICRIPNTRVVLVLGWKERRSKQGQTKPYTQDHSEIPGFEGPFQVRPGVTKPK